MMIFFVLLFSLPSYALRHAGHWQCALLHDAETLVRRSNTSYTQIFVDYFEHPYVFYADDERVAHITDDTRLVVKHSCIRSIIAAATVALASITALMNLAFTIASVSPHQLIIANTYYSLSSLSLLL